MLEMIKPFIEILYQIDRYAFTATQIKSGHLVVMILTIIIDGDSALNFWRDYQEQNFTKAR